MKKSFLAALAVAPLLWSLPSLAKETTTTVKVAGWHCAGCAQETEAAIKKVKGVKSASADFDKHTVVVAYDDAKAQPAQIAKAVSKAGYHIEK